MSVDLIERGEIETFGRLMMISHDGDRVSITEDDHSYTQLNDPYTDDYLNKLISDLASENPGKVLQAQLYMQPGGYACSTPEIDRMVDLAMKVPGVVGVQLAGAGLGGCVMILAEKESVEGITLTLKKNYYDPAELEPEIINCVTVEGAGLIDF
jgi:hypothetical protein